MNNALQQIAQMSDCGSPELTILRMKEIAVEALKNNPQPTDISEGAVGLIIAKGEEERSLLIGALRFLNEEQMISLRDALIARTPKAEQPTDEAIALMAEKEYPVEFYGTSIDINENKRNAFIKGFKSALNNKSVGLDEK